MEFRNALQAAAKHVHENVSLKSKECEKGVDKAKESILEELQSKVDEANAEIERAKNERIEKINSAYLVEEYGPRVRKVEEGISNCVHGIASFDL